MRWNNWLVYALIAGTLTVAAAVWAPAPAEDSITELFRSVPGAGLWGALNDFVDLKWTFAAAVLVVTLAMYVLFPPRAVVTPLAGLAGGMMIQWILASLVARPRPGISGLVNTESFPSAGVMMCAAWLGGVALVCMRRMRSDVLRKGAVALLMVLIALCGVARLASGDHWFLDVAGAWAWAAAWLTWLGAATRGVNA